MKVVGFGKPVTEAACFESLVPHAWLCVDFLLPNSCKKNILKSFRVKTVGS